jgi:hypothetical protein
MTSIIFPTDTKSVIDQIRLAVGRDIEFYTEHKTVCSGCGIDPITNTSINPFCGICGGIGYVISGEITPVLAHITQGNSDQLGWSAGGQYWQGDARVQIEKTPQNEALIASCKYLVVDTKKMSIKSKIFRGTPTLNRILLDLQEEEE